MKTARIVIIGAFLATTMLAAAANWPQWRGPAFNGSSPEKNLPSSWTKTENIAWQLALPGPSAATPVIWNDHVFISSADTAGQTLQALCVDRKTGKIRWQQQTASGIQRDNRSNFASPSPVTDGERVIFFYGSGELVAFDMDGKRIWARNLQNDYGEFAFLWTFSSSPSLYEGTLYMQVLQRDVVVSGRGRKDAPNDSYLLALDPASGRTLWRQIRPSQAVAESREAFTTPVPFEFNGRKEILISGGDDLTGHDPKTGQELWRWGTWNPTRIPHWRLVPSPIAGDGVILACAPKSDPIYAIKAGETGVLDESDIVWKSRRPGPITADVPTPAFYDGDFFIVNDVSRDNQISRVEPQTGKVKWTTELPGRKKFEASPTLADGKIYLMNFPGDVVVLEADTGNILHQTSMGEEGDTFTRSSIAVAYGNLFIRTNRKLFCVGKI